MNEESNVNRTHGLHLATDENISLAWEMFFSACWDAWEVIQQRRAAKQKASEEAEILPAQETRA